MDTPATDAPAPSNAVHRGAPRARVRAYSLKLPESAEDLARSKQKDPFEGLYGTRGITEPPYSYEAITTLLDESDVLQAAVDAIVTNVADFGLQIVPFATNPAPELRQAVDDERRRLGVWFDHAGPPGKSFSAIRALVRFDLELYGDGYYEVLRDRKGRLVGVEHAMTRRMRKTRRDRKAVEVDEWVRTADGAFERRKALRRFRRYVQEPGDGALVWFKEFGDPRLIRSDTGEVDEAAGYEDLANEVIELSRYAADPTYGRPRWRGAANSIRGRTAAGSVNADVFDNKAIPPLLITVQGASLDPTAVEQIKDHFLSARGRDRWHAPLIIEAIATSTEDVSDPMGISRPGAIPKIDVRDLTESIQKDAAFLGYRAACARDVAMSLRLPPLFLGMEASYNFATAQAARQVAEEQVFAPERHREDALLNALILPELGAVHCKVVTKGPPLLTEDVLLKVIETGITSGALTVAQVSDLLEPILGVELSSPENWRKVPAVVFRALASKGMLPPEIAKLLGAMTTAGGADPGTTAADSADGGTGTNDPAAGDGSDANDPAAAQANGAGAATRAA